MMKFVATFMTIVTMFMMGIVNITVETVGDDPYIRLHDEETVEKWTSSGFYDECGNVVWNLDAEES